MLLDYHLDLQIIELQTPTEITQVLTEINEHLAVALPHVLWHSQDTGNIVIQE